MTIIYFTTGFPFYSETFIQEEISQMRDAGHQVVICNLSGYNSRQDSVEYLIINNSKNLFTLLGASLNAVLKGESNWFKTASISSTISSIISYPKFTLKFIFLFLSLDYLESKVKDVNADSFVLHFLFKSTLAGYLVAKNLNIPYHLRLHTKAAVISRSAVKHVIDSADVITAISKDTADFYINSYAYSRDIEVIRQSIALTRLTALAASSKSNSQIKIIAIGRLVEKKGFSYLVNAMALLPSQLQAKIQLDIYGNGGLKEQLQKQINQLQLQSIITLKGVLTHELLMKKLADANLLIVPSIETPDDIDGIPTVIPESMALRTPVLTTSVAGIPELIKDGTTGYIVESKDSKALCNKLEELLGQSEIGFSVIEPAFKKVITEYKSSLAGKLSLDLDKLNIH